MADYPDIIRLEDITSGRIALPKGVELAENDVGLKLDFDLIKGLGMDDLLATTLFTQRYSAHLPKMIEARFGVQVGKYLIAQPPMQHDERYRDSIMHIREYFPFQFSYVPGGTIYGHGIINGHPSTNWKAWSPFELSGEIDAGLWRVCDEPEAVRIVRERGQELDLEWFSPVRRS